ncbi:MAG: CHAT domain-containing tetratricopeptide repeat protein [Balneolaceae bacterium]
MKKLILFGWFSLLIPTLAFSQYADDNGNTLINSGNELYRLGEYEKSEQAYLLAIEEFKADQTSREWVISAVGLGASLIDQGRVMDGAKWIFRADSLSTSKISLELRAYVKSNVGWATWWLYTAERALIEYELALDLAKQSGDEYRIAQVSNSISLLAHDLGRFTEALDYSRNAVNYFHQVDDPFRLSMALSNLFTFYNELGFTEKAEGALLESLSIKMKMGNLDLISSDYNKLGNFYNSKGEYDKALFYFTKYLEDTGNLISPDKRMAALLNIGSVYSSLNRFEDALAFYSQSQELREELEYAPDASTISRIGQVYHELGEFALASSMFNTALEIFSANKDTLSIASTYLKLANLFLDSGNVNLALSQTDLATNFINNSESQKLKSELFATKAQVYTLIKDHNLALDYANMAYGYASNFEGYVQAEYLKLLAESHYLTGSDSAFVYAELAFNEIERVRLNIYGDNLQASLFINYAQFYSTVARWYLEKEGNLEKAFMLVEKGKSRTLLDRMASNIAIEDIVEEAELIEIHQKENAIDQLYRKLENQYEQAAINDLKEQIYKAELEYENLTNKIRITHDELKQLEPPTIISLQELGELCDDKTAFIEYAFIENELIAFWITKNSVDYHVISFDSLSAASVVNNNVDTFRQAIEEMADVNTLTQLSEPLYASLLQPFFAKHPHIKQLFIIPDQGIAHLPFDALISNQEYLVETLSFKFLPSASLIKFIKQSKGSHTSELLALAGSGLGDDSAGSPTRGSLSSMASLPASLLEIESISKHFFNKTLMNKGAVSEAEFKKLALSSYKYIHFASHALINEVNPMQSGLVLANKPSESAYGEDGYLTSLEISSLKLAANLVVLSACNTGFGKVVPGEGLLGLQRSFLKAGASSVMVSLWSIYDRSTAVFMSNFYENLNSFEKEEFGWWEKTLQFVGLYNTPLFDYKAKAIRDAKLKMLEHPYYNHPVYWAPFILIGK